MRKTLIPVFIVLLGLLLVSGCDKKDDATGPGGTVPAELVGTWVFQSAMLNGQSVPLSLLLEWETGTVSAASIVDANANYRYNEYDGANATGSILYYNAGTASVNGSTMTITVTNDNGATLPQPDIVPFSWSLSGTTLTLSTIDIFAQPPDTIVAVLMKK